MEHGRLLVDEAGVEWEIYDESQWSMSMALEWEYPPQRDTPGLIFESTAGLRRLYPCPAEWQTLDDAGLARLLAAAYRLP